MATIDLGKIKFNWRGTYAGGTAYVPDDVVEYTDGSVTSSYICVTASTGNAPSSGGSAHSSWNFLAKGQASSPTTTQGDLIVRGASADERLAIGAAGKILKVNSSANGLEYGTSTTSNHMVLEQFLVPCDGTAVVTPRGSITIQNVTTSYLNTPTYADAPGSTISYNPPSGTNLVIYKFVYHWTSDDNNGIQHLKLQLDGQAITYASRTIRGGNGTYDLPIIYEYGIPIGGTGTMTTGRQATWNSAKTLKLITRNYSNSYHARMHRIGNFDGGGDNNKFVAPQIGITAIGTPS